MLKSAYGVNYARLLEAANPVHDDSGHLLGSSGISGSPLGDRMLASASSDPMLASWSSGPQVGASRSAGERWTDGSRPHGRVPLTAGPCIRTTASSRSERPPGLPLRGWSCGPLGTLPSTLELRVRCMPPSTPRPPRPWSRPGAVDTMSVSEDPFLMKPETRSVIVNFARNREKCRTARGIELHTVAVGDRLPYDRMT